MIKQKRLIDEMLNKDRFLMIILDACRYDYLVELFDERDIDKNIVKADSDVPNTHTWLKEYWQDGYYDLTYVTCIPWVANQPVQHHDAGIFDGSQHFRRVVESWRHSWSSEHKTVLPESIATDVNNNETDRMIAHFAQPHYPHIGEPKITTDHAKNIEYAGDNKNITDDYLRRSYKSNLEKVIDEGVMNINMVDFDNPDRAIIITADHGEALGEDGEYGHNSYHELVTTVPWVEL